MSKLDELINELCPDGVEYKKIKDVYNRIKGTPITAGKMKEIANSDGNIKIFAGGKTVINAMEQDIPKANITRVSAVLVQSRGIIDFIFYDEPFTFKNEMWAYTCDNKNSVKFLYYVLKNKAEFFRDAASSMGSLPQISLPVTEDFKVPVPPIEVQREIVRILDKFTELTQELQKNLTAELTARKKQYEYYRDELLKFDEGVERKTLGELCNIIVGGEVPLDSIKGEIQDEKHQYPIWGNGKDIYGYASTYLIENDAVCISSIGANTGAVFFHKGKFTPIIRLKVLVPKNNDINNKYLFHAVSTINFTPKKSSVPNMSSSDIKQACIYVPSLDEQIRIANILDRLYKLCNDLTEGLPAEIAARQKQYEYYRDKLLTFKEKAK